MSAWIERIVEEFPADVSRFWVACDPDNLLLDESILISLRQRGFEVLPFEDPVAFRADYEERYRCAWDSGADGPAKALILQLRASDFSKLPWDYLRASRKVSLSLANLFPRLSYSVVRQIDTGHHETLFHAHNRYATQQLGESATKDFILTHLFGISRYLLVRPEDFWREVLRLHYRGAGLPELLARHVALALEETPLRELPIAELLSRKNYMLGFVQDAWLRFVAEFDADAAPPSDTQMLETASSPALPFAHPDVRAFVDSMFLEGTLRPVRINAIAAHTPDWVKVGLLSNAGARADAVEEAIGRAKADLPGADASYRAWLEFARRLGEILFRFQSLDADLAAPVQTSVRQLQHDADERLQQWVATHFADLPSLPAAKAPVMVHHVPRHLALRRSAGEDRIALLVFDGLAVDQWIRIREHLSAKASNLTVSETACFAWLPTLTSVSRQALFSGLKPREFAGSIETTSAEASLWTRFWEENDLRKPQILYARGLRRVDQLTELGTRTSDPAVKVAGLVIDMVDEIVHGARLGKRGVASQIDTWCDTGFIERLLLLLSGQGYTLYLTADHGNVEAVGAGRVREGVISELNGERVRVYRSDILAASISPPADAFRLDLPGLPSNWRPLYAGPGNAFVQPGDEIVAHGGISAEELIVPFVRISSGN